jgi:RHS repeat-associated protein
MLASSFLDPVLGLDIHFEMVPTPAPVPTPIPNPFIGIVFDPIGLAAGIAIGAAIGAVVGAPFQGPVLYWTAFPATNTGTEAKHVPGHILIPPGTMWAPFPKTPKPVIHPGETPSPGLPVKPENDAVVVFGSKTVTVMGSNAVRLGDIALSCSEPLRLPSSVVLAVPKGAPILIGGPMSLDIMAAVMASLRTRFVSDSLHALISRLKPSRFRNCLHRAVCFFTGHPVDVASGKVMTEFVDIELPAPLPLKVERIYSSAFASRSGPLGHGWSLSLDQAVWRERGRVVLLAEDGREIEFDTFDFPKHRIAPGQEVYNPIERLTLRCEKDGAWRVVDHEGIVREFALVPGRDDGRAMIQKIRSRCGYHEIGFHYGVGGGSDGPVRGRLEWVRDSGGRFVHLRYDDRGRMTELHLPQPQGEGFYRHRRYEYDAASDLVRVADSLGHDWKFAYVTHLLTQETDRNGLGFYFLYDGVGEDAWCVRTWGDGGIYDHVLSYDKRKHVTFVTNSLGQVTQYHMNVVGQVVKIVDPLGGETKYEYDPATLQRVAETDPLGNTSRLELDDRGNCIAIHHADGTLTSRTYHPELGVLMSSTEPHGAVYAWTHDSSGRVRTRIDPLGNTTHFAWDRGLLTAIETPDRVTTRFAYDARGGLSTTTRSDGSTLRVERDALGRVTKHVSRRGAIQHRRWDTEGRLLELHEPHGVVRRFEYDAERKLTAAGYDGRRIEFGYTIRDHLSERREAGTSIRIEHDTEGRPLAFVNERGERHVLEYDEAGRVVGEHALTGHYTRYVRDVAGRAVRVTSAGSSRELEYNALGRVVGVELGDGGFERFIYRQDGILLEATNTDAKVTFAVDTIGRVLEERVTDSRGNEHVVRSAYSAAGGRIRVSDSDAHALYIERDPGGHAARIELRNPSPRWSASFERDPDGFERRVVLDQNLEIGWARDAVGRPVERQVTSSRGLLDRTQIGWNGDARLSFERSSKWGERTFSYDARARPIAMHVDGGTSLRLLDDVGNPFETESGADRTYGPGGTPLRVRDATFVYDDDGRPVERHTSDGGITRFSWSSSGLLREAALPDGRVVKFEYDAFARRLRKDVYVVDDAGELRPLAEHRWGWDGGMVVHEQSSEHGSTRWIYEPDSHRPLAQVTDAGVWAFATDGIGTPTELVDEEGAVRWTGRMDLMGRVVVGGEARQPLRWPGQYYDDETGLVYNRYRYYSPEAGLFVSPDPIGISGGLRLHGYPIDPFVAFDLLGWISEFIYRAVRAEEIDTAMTDGLTARNPGASHTPTQHVLGDNNSQFISGSDGDKGARMADDWARRSNTGVVKIDVSKLDPDSIVDLSTGEGRIRHLGDVSASPSADLLKANKFARGKREVLIIGRIPPDAIVEVKDHRSSSCT